MGVVHNGIANGDNRVWPAIEMAMKGVPGIPEGRHGLGSETGLGGGFSTLRGRVRKEVVQRPSKDKRSLGSLLSFIGVSSAYRANPVCPLVLPMF